MNGIDEVASRQLGLITTSQLRLLGITEEMQTRAVLVGRLIPMRPRVLRTAGAPVTQQQAWLAAVLAAGKDALLSHWSAAQHFQFHRTDPRDGIDVLVSARVRPRLSGVRPHCTVLLPAADRHTYQRIPVTSPARTIIDICGSVPPWLLGPIVNDAIRRGLLTDNQLLRAVASVPVSGRRAIRPIRAVLAGRIPGYGVGDSEPELDILRLVTEAGYDPPVQNFKVRIGPRTYEVDIAWPRTKVGLEYDSWEFHGGTNTEAFHRDREKVRALQLAGWGIYPVTSRTRTHEILAIAELASARIPLAG